MEKLGIDPILLLAQTINFGLIVLLLRKFLYKPILDLLEKRKKEIAEGIELTEKLRVEEEKYSAKKAKLLDTARAEAGAIISDAKQKAKEQANIINEQANSEASSLISKAKEDISQQKKAMELEMRSYAVNLAVSMAKRLLTVALTEKEVEKILDRHLEEIKSIRVTS